MGLQLKESNMLNDLIFGNSEGKKVKNANGAGSINLKVYDKETGEVSTLSKVLDNSNEEDDVKITTKFTPNHLYTTLANGDSSFTDAYQLNLGGKEYILSGPTGHTGIKENLEYKERQAINSIAQVKLSELPVEKRIHNKDVLISFVSLPEKKLEGHYEVYKKVPNSTNIEKLFEGDTAEQVNRFLLQ